MFLTFFADTGPALLEGFRLLGVWVSMHSEVQESRSGGFGQVWAAAVNPVACGD